MESLLGPECISMNVDAAAREQVFRQGLEDCPGAGSVWRLFERHMVK